VSVAEEDIAFARDIFSELGKITSRKMMGGATFYADGAIFAIVSGEGQIYLRSKDALAARLLSEGERKFQWENPKTGKVGSMGYVTLPDAALDDPALACSLAREALLEG